MLFWGKRWTDHCRFDFAIVAQSQADELPSCSKLAFLNYPELAANTASSSFDPLMLAAVDTGAAPPRVQALAWAAQKSLCGRYRRLANAGASHPVR